MIQVIRDCDGNVIQSSPTLMGIRGYVGKHLIKMLDISPVGDGEGQLSILFDDRSSFQTHFADFGVLKSFVRNWRNVYGAPLSIGGIDCGKVKYRNKALAEKNMLPTIAELKPLLIRLKGQIRDEYRASDDADDNSPAMSVTIGWNEKTGDWSYQTGDNSYTGGAYSYPIWAVVTLDRRSNSTNIAKDIISQLADQSSQ
jgi:hypothetical protein